MELIIGLLITVLILSLVFSILLGCLKLAAELFLLPIRVGWWLIKLPFRILFG